MRRCRVSRTPSEARSVNRAVPPWIWASCVAALIACKGLGVTPPSGPPKLTGFQFTSLKPGDVNTVYGSGLSGATDWTLTGQNGQGGPFGFTFLQVLNDGSATFTIPQGQSPGTGAYSFEVRSPNGSSNTLALTMLCATGYPYCVTSASGHVTDTQVGFGYNYSGTLTFTFDRPVTGYTALYAVFNTSSMSGTGTPAGAPAIPFTIGGGSVACIFSQNPTTVIFYTGTSTSNAIASYQFNWTSTQC